MTESRMPSARFGAPSAWRRFRALLSEVFSDHAMMLAAGLALHGLLGALPALAAAAAVWGLVADVSVLEGSLERARGLLPPQAVQLLGEFVTSVGQGFGLGIGLVVSLAFAIWAAMRSGSGLITALNIAFDRDERRGWLRRTMVALLIALGGSGTLLLAFAILALPPWVAAGSDGVLGRVLLLARWPALALLFATALGVLLRLAPSPSPGTHRTGWMSWGAVVGTMLWVAASYGLTLYVENVGAFGRLYGSLGSVVVVMMWFYLGAMAALVGAEIEGMRERESEGRGEDALKSALRRREKG